MKTAATVFLSLALAACGGTPAQSAADGSAGASQANAEAVSRIGDITVRASAIQTSRLDAAIAGGYGIARDDGRVLLLVAVRRGPEGGETSVPATITARATDLRGQTRPIAMRELRAGDLIDSIGTLDIAPPDTVRFDVTILREGGATSTMQFTREFYPH